MSFVGRIFENASIRSKITTLSTVSLVLMLAIAAVATWSAMVNREGLEMVRRTGTLEKRVTVSIADNLTRSQGDMYRVLLWYQNKVDDDRIAGFDREIKERLAETKAAIEALMADDAIGEAERSALESLAAKVEEYSGQAESVLMMAKADPDIASLTLVTTEQLFGDMRSALEEIIAVAHRRGETSFREAEDTADAAMTHTLILLGVALAGSVLVTGLVSRGISRPVLGLATVMSQLANGDTATEVVGVGRGDEVGVMARAVDVFKRAQIDLARSSERLLETGIRERRAQEMERLTSDFDRRVGITVDSVAAAASSMEETARMMLAVASQTEGQADAAASASRQASANVQTVAAGAEELSASVAEINRLVVEFDKDFRSGGHRRAAGRRSGRRP